ncbi:hypothetical protein Pint_19370 [Pistacia integerrima]|uniref:Uncharacterized protein n=1 Tax=Pistacia integerrima TaxID=434235 RepID=A0ACC0YYE6_9ROSI|nr:hypothetical protein Pint_19370 [Pistacia integerrima]
MNDSSFKSSLDLNPRRDDDDDQRKSKVDDYKIKLPVPSIKRLFTLNLPEWKQASMGCLSAIFSDETSSGAICSRLAKDANVGRSLVLFVQTVSAVSMAFALGLVIA